MIAAEAMAAHLQRVRERWAQLESGEGAAEMQAKLSRIERRISNLTRIDCVSRAFDATRMEAKVHWFRKDAGEVHRSVSTEAACRLGCSHCCHTSVMLPKPEAEVIAREIGRKLFTPKVSLKATPEQPHTADFREDEAERHHGKPCPFLGRHGSCDIYASRPMACRWQFNLDRDAMLCELVPAAGEKVRVPYLNMTDVQMYYVQAMGLESEVADIREWFPGEAA